MINFPCSYCGHQLESDNSAVGSYLVSGLTGGLASLMSNQNVVSAGASGAIFGVYSALLAFLVGQRGCVPWSVFKQLQNSTLGFVAYSLLYGSSKSDVDNAAHIGGLVGGFLIGLMVSRPLALSNRNRLMWPRLVVGLAGSALVLYLSGNLALRFGTKHQQELRFHTEAKRFAQEAREISSSANELFLRARSGALTEGEFAKHLEEKCLWRWDKALARLSRIQLGEKAPWKERHQPVLKLGELQRDMFRTLLEAMKNHDQSKVKELEALTSAIKKIQKEMEGKGAQSER